MPLWLFWILLGLIAGSLAKFIMPGRDPAGCIFTIVLGVVGAMLGGLIGTQLGWGKIDAGDLDLRSIAIATFGALVVLGIGADSGGGDRRVSSARRSQIRRSTPTADRPSPTGFAICSGPRAPLN